MSVYFHLVFQNNPAASWQLVILGYRYNKSTSEQTARRSHDKKRILNIEPFHSQPTVSNAFRSVRWCSTAARCFSTRVISKDPAKRLTILSSHLTVDSPEELQIAPSVQHNAPERSSECVFSKLGIVSWLMKLSTRLPMNYLTDPADRSMCSARVA
jgi:hypothetical protein